MKKIWRRHIVANNDPMVISQKMKRKRIKLDQLWPVTMASIKESRKGKEGDLFQSSYNKEPQSKWVIKKGPCVWVGMSVCVTHLDTVSHANAFFLLAPYLVPFASLRSA